MANHTLVIPFVDNIAIKKAMNTQEFEQIVIMFAGSPKGTCSITFGRIFPQSKGSTRDLSCAA